MVSFKKNKADNEVKTHRYRYDVTQITDDEIADVLLNEKTKGSAKADAQNTDEIIFDLLEEVDAELAETADKKHELIFDPIIEDESQKEEFIFDLLVEEENKRDKFIFERVAHDEVSKDKFIFDKLLLQENQKDKQIFEFAEQQTNADATQVEPELIIELTDVLEATEDGFNAIPDEHQHALITDEMREHRAQMLEMTEEFDSMDAADDFDFIPDEQQHAQITDEMREHRAQMLEMTEEFDSMDAADDFDFIPVEHQHAQITDEMREYRAQMLEMTEEFETSEDDFDFIPDEHQHAQITDEMREYRAQMLEISETSLHSANLMNLVEQADDVELTEIYENQQHAQITDEMREHRAQVFEIVDDEPPLKLVFQLIEDEEISAIADEQAIETVEKTPALPIVFDLIEESPTEKIAISASEAVNILEENQSVAEKIVLLASEAVTIPKENQPVAEKIIETPLPNFTFAKETTETPLPNFTFAKDLDFIYDTTEATETTETDVDFFFELIEQRETAARLHAAEPVVIADETPVTLENQTVVEIPVETEVAVVESEVASVSETPVDAVTYPVETLAETDVNLLETQTMIDILVEDAPIESIEDNVAISIEDTTIEATVESVVSSELDTETVAPKEESKATAKTNARVGKREVRSTFSKQIQQVHRECDALKLQLGEITADANEMRKQISYLKRAKRNAVGSQLALVMAAILALTMAGAAVIGGDIQRELTALKDNIAVLENALKRTRLPVAEISAQTQSELTIPVATKTVEMPLKNNADALPIAPLAFSQVLSAELQQQMYALNLPEIVSSTTPEMPEKVVIPETAEKVVTPETPEKVVIPKTAEKLVTPETAEKVVTPETAEKVVTPETAEKVVIPETAVTPKNATATSVSPAITHVLETASVSSAESPEKTVTPAVASVTIKNADAQVTPPTVLPLTKLLDNESSSPVSSGLNPPVPTPIVTPPATAHLSNIETTTPTAPESAPQPAMPSIQDVVLTEESPSPDEAVATASETSPKTTQWWVSLGAFRNKEMADMKLSTFKKIDAHIERVEVKIKKYTWYRLVTPPFASQQQAREYMAHLKKTTTLRTISIIGQDKMPSAK